MTGHRTGTREEWLAERLERLRVGLDGLWGSYQWLDRAPRGRNESGGIWWRRHDEYGES
ncbi:DUF899 family protein [Halomonas elongata]|uniref:DUF899 family protein n=1 Tax=Halomonas elongata TaxID=2746 RepID=UPI0023AE9166|nr:DUF899 family protein [Halomonas elongata]